MTAFLALVALVAQEPRPFRAKVVLEEFVRSGDSVTRTQGTALLRPGESVTVQLSGRRLVYRGDGLHPLDFWALGSAELQERFAVVVEAVPGERALPESVEGIPVLKARRPGRSLATAGGAERGEACARYVPRDAALKHVAIRAWRVEGRLVRVEIETPARRTVCALEAIRELEMEER